MAPENGTGRQSAFHRLTGITKEQQTTQVFREVEGEGGVGGARSALRPCRPCRKRPAAPPRLCSGHERARTSDEASGRRDSDRLDVVSRRTPPDGGAWPEVLGRQHLALPSDLAGSLRHLDDRQLDRLMRAVAAEARQAEGGTPAAGSGDGGASDPPVLVGGGEAPDRGADPRSRRFGVPGRASLRRERQPDLHVAPRSPLQEGERGQPCVQCVLIGALIRRRSAR